MAYVKVRRNNDFWERSTSGRNGPGWPASSRESTSSDIRLRLHGEGSLRVEESVRLNAESGDRFDTCSGNGNSNSHGARPVH